MPDRHRHDEFIWALIFSLIINFLFVFALLTQRYVKKSPLQPFIVSIAARHQALPAESPAIPAPDTIPVAVEKRAPAPPPTLRPQNKSVEPVLPARANDEEATLSPMTTAARTGPEIALSSLTTAGESAPATLGKEISDGLSIFEDKSAGDNYTAPEYLVGEKPPYPKWAERNGWEGTVLLTLSIDANGEVQKLEIAKSSGYELLDQQARKSVSAWRFKPARRNGMTIAVTVQQPVIFRSTPPGKPQ